MPGAHYKTHQAKKACENKLGIDFPGKRGKEDNGWYYLDGKKLLRVTLARGRKDIPPKTHGSIASQLWLTKHQLDDLVDCPLSGADFEAIVRNRKSES